MKIFLTGKEKREGVKKKREGNNRNRNSNNKANDLFSVGTPIFELILVLSWWAVCACVMSVFCLGASPNHARDNIEDGGGELSSCTTLLCFHCAQKPHTTCLLQM